MYKILLFLTCMFLQNITLWGIDSILIIDIAKHFPNQAIQIFSGFNLSVFGLPICFGILADKYNAHLKILIIGYILTAIGAINLITAETFNSVSFGLSLIACGICMYRGTSITLFGLLLDKVKKSNKEKMFTIRHGVLNVGSIVGSIFFAIIGQNNWHYCFYIISFLSVLAAILAYIALSTLKFENRHYLLSALFSTPIIVGIMNASMRSKLILTLCLVLIFLIIFVNGFKIYKNASCIRRKEFNIIFLNALICFAFYFLLLQKSTSLTLFAKQYVDLHLIGFLLPATIVSSMQPIFAVIFAKPICWTMDTYPLAFNKYRYHLCFICMLACVFTIIFMSEFEAIYQSSVNIAFIMICGALMGIAELVVYPPALATIDKYSPPELRATIMSSFSLVIALAASSAGSFTEYFSKHNIIDLSQFNSAYIAIFVAFSFLYLFVIKINKNVALI